MSSLPKKIVLVDDNRTVLAASEKAFETAGYTVWTKEQALGTAVLALRIVPDAIVLDVQMPALGGNHLALLLKSMPDLKNCKVVLHSSLPFAELTALGIECRADAVLHKQSNADSLVKLVNDLVKETS